MVEGCMEQNNGWGLWTQSVYFIRTLYGLCRMSINSKNFENCNNKPEKKQ